MAWGYWSATTISDRGRSPRRNQNGTTTATSAAVAHSVPITTLEIERPCVSQTYSTASTVINSNNPQQQVVTDYEVAAGLLSRRPSLDLGSLGPQGALAGILCAAHGSRQQQQQQQGVGTLSAGNTLTRVGSRHTAVEYAVPHHFHHHHAAYIEYHHQAQLSFSDDDSSSEPGYATGSDLDVVVDWIFLRMLLYLFNDPCASTEQKCMMQCFFLLGMLIFQQLFNSKPERNLLRSVACVIEFLGFLFQHNII